MEITSWNWVLPLCAFASIVYLFFELSSKTKNRKTGTGKDLLNKLNENLMSVLYAAGLLAIFWFLVPALFPNFWGKYYGSDIFWPTVLIGVLCLYMWSQKYFLFMFIFFVILMIVLSRFGDFKTSKRIAKESTASVIVWKFHSSSDSTIHYSGPVNVKINLEYSTKYRITPECGRLVTIVSYNWDHAELIKGCNKGTKENLPFNKWIIIQSAD